MIAKHYVGKLMGDSPKLMPLDSSLFSDQIENVAKLVVATASLEEEERFTMATPDKAWTTMVAAWGMLKSDRIVQDIDRFVPALDSIIAAEGAYVSDKDLRNGHRRPRTQITAVKQKLLSECYFSQLFVTFYQKIVIIWCSGNFQ